MTGETARSERLSTALWAVTAVFGVAGTVLTVVVWSRLASNDAFPNLASGASGIFYATLGAA